MTRYVIGVDLGGTHLRAAVIDEQGHVRYQVKRKTLADEGPEAVIARIAATITEVGGQVEGTRVEGVGLAAPAPVDTFAGIVYNPPNLPGWGVVNLSQLLSHQTGFPTFVGNDANLAALGEHAFGAGIGRSDLVYLTISTGIGGGVITGGELLLGTRGLAAEVGHMLIQPHGPMCGCGLRGHLEAMASGPSIARTTSGLLRAGQPSSLTLDENGAVSTEAIVSAARAGDALAVRVLGQAGEAIGMAIASLVHLLAPSRCIIGGGVSNAGNLLFEPIRKSALANVLAAYRDTFDVVPAALGDDAGLYGAAALVLQKTRRG